LWDNAQAESFFDSLKKERVKKKIYKNRSIAHCEIAEYIEALLAADVRAVIRIGRPERLKALFECANTLLDG
jgi:Integrase core domain